MATPSQLMTFGHEQEVDQSHYILRAIDVFAETIYVCSERKSFIAVGWFPPAQLLTTWQL